MNIYKRRGVPPDIMSYAARLYDKGAAKIQESGDSLSTDKAVVDESKTLALMPSGQGRVKIPMRARARALEKLARSGPLAAGQKAAEKLILGQKDRVMGVRGYAGTGKTTTTVLKRVRALLQNPRVDFRELTAAGGSARAGSGGEMGHRQRTL